MPIRRAQVHRTHGQVISVRAEADRAALLALPEQPYLVTDKHLRRVGKDCLVSFEGRNKELIRRGGENIAPAQVEGVLREHPAVIDAAVVPVADPIRDEEVKAYVQVRGEVDPAELAAYCARHLAPHKVPRYIELRTEPFPMTASQRIRKHELKVDGTHRIEGSWDRLASETDGERRA